MIALKKEPNKGLTLITMENSLRALQEAVGGKIEAVTIGEDMAIICNEEGRLKGLPYNCSYANIDFVGNILAVGVSGEEITDVPASAAPFLQKNLKTIRE